MAGLPDLDEPLDVLLLRGRVDLQAGTAEITDASVVSSTDAQFDETGDYRLELFDEQGALVAFGGFDPSFAGPADPLLGGSWEPPPGLFGVRVPLPDVGIARAEVTYQGERIGGLEVGAGVPSVEVVTPDLGETVSGSGVHVVWTGTDPDGEASRVSCTLGCL